MECLGSGVDAVTVLIVVEWILGSCEHNLGFHEMVVMDKRRLMGDEVAFNETLAITSLKKELGKGCRWQYVPFLV